MIQLTPFTPLLILNNIFTDASISLNSSIDGNILSNEQTNYHINTLNHIEVCLG